MILTSEVENILNGQVVRKSDNDKAIGIATSNLQPNEKGIVPLSNQDAFTILKTENVNVNTQVPTQEMSSPATVAPVSEVTPELNSNSQVPVQNEQGEEKLESIEYNKGSDIIENSPVDVQPPTSLEAFNFGAKPAESQQTIVSQEVTAPQINTSVEMPKMPTEILAQEPQNVNEGLFTTNANLNNPLQQSNVVSETQEVTPFVVPTIENPIENFNVEEEKTHDTAPNEKIEIPTEVKIQPETVESVSINPVDTVGELNVSAPSVEMPSLEEPSNIPSLNEAIGTESIFDNLETDKEDGKSAENKLKLDDHIELMLSEILAEIKDIKSIIKENKLENKETKETVVLDAMPQMVEVGGPENNFSQPIVNSAPEEIPFTNEISSNNIPSIDTSNINPNSLESIKVDDGVIRGGHFGL